MQQGLTGVGHSHRAPERGIKGAARVRALQAEPELLPSKCAQRFARRVRRQHNCALVRQYLRVAVKCNPGIYCTSIAIQQLTVHPARYALQAVPMSIFCNILTCGKKSNINTLLHLDSRKDVQRAELHVGRLRVEALAGGHVDSKDERVVLWRQLVDAPVKDLHRAQMTWPMALCQHRQTGCIRCHALA